MQASKVEGHSIVNGWLNSKSLVVDVGATEMDFACATAQEYGCRVVAIEPLPSPRDITIDEENDNITLMQSAMLSHRGRATIQGTSGHHGNTVILTNLATNKNVQHSPVSQVQAVDLEYIITRYGSVDCLKLDCEGSEYDIIMNTKRNTLLECKQISVEFHSFNNILTEQQVGECFDYLGQEYEIISSDARKKDCLWVRKDLLASRTTEHGSSKKKHANHLTD